jgi:hypothetical protein
MVRGARTALPMGLPEGNITRCKDFASSIVQLQRPSAISANRATGIPISPLLREVTDHFFVYIV